MLRRQLLPDSALESLARLTDAVRAAEAADATWLSEVGVHFLRNFTTEPLDPYLKFHVLREDIGIRISHGGYGTMAQELLHPTSDTSRSHPEVIVLSLLIELLDSNVVKPGWSHETALWQMDDLVRLLIERTRSLIIANTFILPIDLIGSTNTDEVRSQIEELNTFMRQAALKNPSRIRIIEWDVLLESCDTTAAIDRRFWKSSLAPFRTSFLDLYSRRIAGSIRSLKGRSKKCLVLDCDNTLWGGVIGEDGIEGIELGEHSDRGRHFSAFQARVKELRERGIMVAVCSKNNEEDVWDVLENHPHCLLCKSDLVGWCIDWEDKASNLAKLAEELNIGLDSIVFVDDSPQERELVASLLPEVTVLAVPEDLSKYPSLFERDGFFETLAQTHEDQIRAQMYQEQAIRRSHRQLFAELDDFLRSLATVLRIRRIKEADVERVAQLTRKTNQFNLTTRRYSDEQIRELASNRDVAIYAMAVSDRYGDMGLTGVFIAKRDGATAVIDTLLLSCRVLGRRLEFGFVDQCMRLVDELWQPEVWHAEYILTSKNDQVRGFWPDVGLELEGEDNGRSLYRAQVPVRRNDYLEIMTIVLE